VIAAISLPVKARDVNVSKPEQPQNKNFDIGIGLGLKNVTSAWPRTHWCFWSVMPTFDLSAICSYYHLVPSISLQMPNYSRFTTNKAKFPKSAMLRSFTKCYSKHFTCACQKLFLKQSNQCIELCYYNTTATTKTTTTTSYRV